jgi:hypothetical protein
MSMSPQTIYKFIGNYRSVVSDGLKAETLADNYIWSAEFPHITATEIALLKNLSIGDYLIKDLI